MDNNADHRQEDEDPAADDQDTGSPVAPIIKLEEVAISTGEEEEQPLLDLKGKLYRFDMDGNQWNERGVGSVKLLKHNLTGKVRLLMRQSKTLKICANHLIVRGMSVQQHAGKEKSCVWNATDFAGDELKDELFCIRFASIENCSMFLDSFQEIVKSQNQESNNGENQENEKINNNGDNQENEKNNGDNQENEKNKNNGENQEDEKNNDGEKQSHEENRNNGDNKNHEKNHNNGDNQNHEENYNNGEKKNHEENQNNEEKQDKANKDASATARLLKNLNVEDHCTST